MTYSTGKYIFNDPARNTVLTLPWIVLYSCCGISSISSRVKNTDFGGQAVALDEKYEATEEEYRAWHKLLKDNGVKIVAPPMWMRKLPAKLDYTSAQLEHTLTHNSQYLLVHSGKR